MPKKTIIKGIALVVLTAAFLGCAKPPQEELGATQAALAAAAKAEADRYVADLYTAARNSFFTAQIEIETQNARVAFSRNYDRAESLLAYARQTAIEARAQVETRRETMRTDNEALFLQAEQIIARAQKLIARAPRGRHSAIALASVQEGAGTAAQILGDARAVQETGDYPGAHELAQGAIEQVNHLLGELEAAIAGTRTAPRS